MPQPTEPGTAPGTPRPAEAAAPLPPAPARRSRRERHRGRVLGATALPALLALTACSGSGSADARDPGTPAPTSLPAELTGQQLDWGDCSSPGRGVPEPGERWRCATLVAPLDWSQPEGETLDLALIRAEATHPGDRIGSLLFNFGGPGASGVAGLPPFADAFRILGERYDLVSFDPRGVAGSSGIRCRSDEELDAAQDVDMTPDTASEEKAYLADAADFGAGCERRAGELLPRVSTTSAARDMDLMRRVLGDGKLSYFGFSYGTQLGGTYAHLFPERVGRLVLDAAVDPTADATGHALNQTIGFQRALENYLESTGEDPKTGSERIADLLARIDREPLPTGGERVLSETQALLGIVSALYSQSGWEYLTRGLEDAEDGKGDALLALADEFNGRDAQGRYSTQSHSQRAIGCADQKQRPTVADMREELPRFREASPVFGEFLGWDTAGWCASWPVAGESRTPEVSAPGADPVLVVGTTGDPATPVEGARRMADELGGDVGVLLTLDGEGHGAYTSGDPCVTEAVHGYLLDGEAPADGTEC